jgi:hypothetical protein
MENKNLKKINRQQDKLLKDKIGANVIKLMN